MIDHRKVLVLALNGPAVGAAAAYFPAFADIVLAAETAYLQAPFSRLGLVPEFGSITGYAHSVGVHRATEFFTFGRRLSAEELQHWGMVNRLFPAENFHQKVLEFLEEQLSVNDGTSMMEAKRLQNLAFRRDRLLAVYEAADALGERVAEGAHTKRFEEQNRKQAGQFLIIQWHVILD
jgi:peroxisomal 3,2-trans-enoyl-CoA isomerase